QAFGIGQLPPVWPWHAPCTPHPATGGSDMTMHSLSKCGYIVASAIAITATAAQTLGAQGARRGVRAVASAASVQPERSGVSPARSLLHGLVGTWRFEIWFAGNLDGAPDASGTRVMRVLFDDLRVEWTEQ